LNSLPKSWSTFQQIQKGRERLASFPEVEGLLLQEELGRTLDKQRDDSEEVHLVRAGRNARKGGFNSNSHGHSHNTGRGRGNNALTQRHNTIPQTQPTSHNQNTVICHQCCKEGHYARDCAQFTLKENIKAMQLQLSNIQRNQKRQQSMQHINLAEVNDEAEDDELDSDTTPIQACIKAFHEEDVRQEEFINACFDSPIKEDYWFLDSGVSSHVTSNPHLFRSILPSRVLYNRTTGGQIMPVQGQGTVTITDCSGKIKDVHHVIYVPSIKTSLFSVGKLIDLGYRVLFESTQCSIYDKNQPDQLLLHGTRDIRNNLY